MLLVIALFAALSHLAPQLTRQDIFFGVTIAPGFRHERTARMVSRRYTREVWLLALMAAVLVGTSRAPLLSVPVLAAQGFGAFVAFAKARRALLPYAAAPTALREAELAPRPPLPGGAVGQLGPFAIVLASAAHVALHWSQFPTRFPTHWNISGRPDGWSHKSFADVFEVLWYGLVGCGLGFATSYGVMHASRVPNVNGTAGRSDRQVRRVNLMLLLAGAYLVAVCVSWVVIAPIVVPDVHRLPLLLIVSPFVVAVVATLSIMRLRQRSSRQIGIKAVPVGDTTPDSCWKWGRYYFNPSDPAVFVEKRFGWGYTLNLGHRVSWLVVILTIVALLFPLLLPR